MLHAMQQDVNICPGCFSSFIVSPLYYIKVMCDFSHTNADMIG